MKIASSGIGGADCALVPVVVYYSSLLLWRDLAFLFIVVIKYNDTYLSHKHSANANATVCLALVCLILVCSTPPFLAFSTSAAPGCARAVLSCSCTVAAEHSTAGKWW
jgi:hypothetical protein